MDAAHSLLTILETDPFPCRHHLDADHPSPAVSSTPRVGCREGAGDWISPFRFSDAFSPKHPVEVAVDANARNEKMQIHLCF